MQSNRGAPAFQWQVYLQWVLASTLGWLIGGAFLLGLTTGAAMGLTQWLVLRPFLPKAWRWIVASALGWILGWPLITLLPAGAGFLATAVLGLTVGLAQWVVLRDWAGRMAVWWLVISVLGWFIGLSDILGETLNGFVVGAVTGIAIELYARFLWRRPDER